MSEVFIGEIRLFGFDFVPVGCAQCNGQLLPIAQNNALYALLGVKYGGNGTNNFALPDLRGRVPVGFGTSAAPSWNPSGYNAIGRTGGEENHTLLAAEMPMHTHPVGVAGNATSAAPGGAVMLAASITSKPFRSGPAEPASLAPTGVGSTGNGTAHQNVQPYLVLNFAIALTGWFPSRN